jgi:hypothetical protein
VGHRIGSHFQPLGARIEFGFLRVATRRSNLMKNLGRLYACDSSSWER